jgi:CTP:molybdopterin cytidylyltransferase MocA
MTAYIKHKNRPKASAVIVAAGGSTRMGGTDKVKTLLSGIPVLGRCVAAFADSKGVDEIVIVTSET